MPNRNGARGIHAAAMKGHVAVINSLIAKGECVDAVTNVSLTRVCLFNFRHFFNVHTTYIPFTLYQTPQVLKYKLFKAFFMNLLFPAF